MRATELTHWRTKRYKVIFASLLVLLVGIVVWSPGDPRGVAAQGRPSPTRPTPATPTLLPTVTPGPTATLAPPSPPSAPSHRRNEPLSIRGKVTNWGHNDEALITVSFTRPDGSVLETRSDVLGVYEFYAIANQMGAINIEGDWPGHHMLTQDIFVRPHPGEVIELRLGFYSGAEYPEMPVSATLSLTPEKPSPGDLISVRAEIVNRMAVPITQLWLTDYLGQELAFVGTGGAGQAEYTDGLVMINLDRLEPGASTWVTMDARLSPSLSPGASFTNRASIFYRESVAVQAAVEIKVGGAETVASPTVAASESQAQPTATSEADSDENLPLTGAELPTASVQERGEEAILEQEANSELTAPETVKATERMDVASRAGVSPFTSANWLAWGFVISLSVVGLALLAMGWKWAGRG